jgi:hypothetical protein
MVESRNNFHKAFLIHGAFQDSSTLEALAKVLEYNNICVQPIDLALHGSQKLASINKNNVCPQTLAQQIIERPELVDLLNHDIRKHLTIIGHSLGAMVAIQMASKLQTKNTSISLVAIEPILRLDASCQGQKDFISQLDNMQSSRDPFQLPIIQYFSQLYEQDKASTCSSDLTQSINKLAENKNIHIHIIKGNQNYCKNINHTIKLFENTSNSSDFKCVGQELGTLLPDHHFEDLSSEIPITTIKESGHNPLVHIEFYSFIDQLAKSL